MPSFPLTHTLPGDSLSILDDGVGSFNIVVDVELGEVVVPDKLVVNVFVSEVVVTHKHSSADFTHRRNGESTHQESFQNDLHMN